MRLAQVSIRFVVVSSLALVVGCSKAPRSGGIAAPGPDARPASLTKFDWSPPCRVPVVESLTFDDDSQRVRFVVEVLPAAGGTYEVRLRDFALLELNGEDMSAPERTATANGLVAISAGLPVMVVGADGRFRSAGAIETDRIVDELHLSPEQASTFRAAMAGRPGPEEADRVAHLWRSWVGAWVDWTVAPGAPRDGEQRVSFAAAGELPVAAHLEHGGVTTAPLVRLSARFVVTGAALASLEKRVIDLVVASQPSPPPRATALVGGSEELVYSAETDPRTLRPVHTHAERNVQLELAELGANATKEVRDVQWDWAHAQGCGR